MKSIATIIVFSVLLAGCAGGIPTTDATNAAQAKLQPIVSVSVTQAAAKRMIAADRSRLWIDPNSIREAKIGEPFYCPAMRTTCVCVEANARNSYGGLTGLNVNLFVFHDGAPVEGIGVTHAPQQCGRFTPFPELNGKGR